MKRGLPPFVYRRTVKGRVYHRFMRGAVSQQIDPSAPDFWTLYAKLMEGETIRLPKKRTFTNLISDYRASDAYKARAARTKKDYGRVLARIEAKMGDKDPAGVRKVHVVQWQRELSGRDGVGVLGQHRRRDRLDFRAHDQGND